MKKVISISVEELEQIIKSYIKHQYGFKVEEIYTRLGYCGPDLEIKSYDVTVKID